MDQLHERSVLIYDDGEKLGTSSSMCGSAACALQPDYGQGGTPNDVRMFPVKSPTKTSDAVLPTAAASCPTTTMAVGGCSSRSIPIAPAARSRHEVRLDEEEAMAKYREYCMYRRIAGKNSDEEDNNKTKRESCSRSQDALAHQEGAAFHRQAEQTQESRTIASFPGVVQQVGRQQNCWSAVPDGREGVSGWTSLGQQDYFPQRPNYRSSDLPHPRYDEGSNNNNIMPISSLPSSPPLASAGPNTAGFVAVMVPGCPAPVMFPVAATTTPISIDEAFDIGVHHHEVEEGIFALDL